MLCECKREIGSESLFCSFCGKKVARVEIMDGPFEQGMDAAYGMKFEHTVCYEYRGQKHFRPNADVKYWREDKHVSGDGKRGGVAIDFDRDNEKMLSILVPFYNEEAAELMMTLNSIYPDFASLKALGFDVHILLVMDGWWKASESMKGLMCQFFKSNQCDVGAWWDAIRPIGVGDDLSECVGTFVVQRMMAGGESIASINIGDHLMKMSLLVKRDNRRKINGHDWMLSSFAEFYKSKFVFLTDCGTLFGGKCLTLLARELLKRPHCTAVSGRQRIMTAEQQGSKEWWGVGWGALFRAAQSYDYECSLASFVGAFSLFGMLPVIPGPCGLYRYDAIKKHAVQFYIDAVAAHPSECGILLANLNLAEDRVLSYAAVLKTDEDSYTCYVPEAVFYFAAETTPLMLFQQRRRWINGTIAGYLWLLSKPSIIWTSGLQLVNKPFLTLLLVCQLFMYLAVAISPAIFVSSFYWSSAWAGDRFFKADFEKYYIPEVLSCAYILIYVAFVVKHASPDQKPAVSGPFVRFITVVNMLAMMIIIASLASGLNVTWEARKEAWLSFSGLGLEDWVIFLILFALIGPFILALFHSPKSFVYMLLCVVQFYLLLPTMVTFIGVYALSRVWDLSWGNRPSEKSSLKATQTAEVQRMNNEKIIRSGTIIAYGIMFVNLVIGAALAWPYYSTYQRELSLIALAFFVFAWSAIQMVFSSVYFIGRNLRRLQRIVCRWCCIKLCCCYSKKEWETGEA
ncbi:MAG: hypothetical protein Hyperionvirus23_6 [Hyperionvirus sp.]|uniref:chitin synthase n=1 Tax=Hyperionvirus sp. TaxID=2487770 RepID=A0A3G5AG28_9VIRU|nr:MAG: hypothetical protein Hyperionvirus23_6 [Hyperionvirus sp.]